MYSLESQLKCFIGGHFSAVVSMLACWTSSHVFGSSRWGIVNLHIQEVA